MDWLVYDDESMNFLTTLDNEDFKLNSYIKFLNQKDKGSKVLFEDVLENTKLQEEEMKEMFIDLSYPTGEEGVDKEITKRFIRCF